jgi:hypothetical protein
LLTPAGIVHVPLPDVNVTTVYKPLVVVLKMKEDGGMPAVE